MATLDKSLLLEMFRKMEEIRRMDLKIAQLVKNNPDIKKRIIQSTQNVNLEKILGWKDSNGKYSYLDKF